MNNGQGRKKERIIIIGLDSADPDLVQLWTKEGRLPFLASLIESGVWSRLISTRGLFADSPWPSFNTGVSPAKHGFYDYLQLKRGTMDIVRRDARFCRYLPFWWLLREAGKKVAVFDVPKTYPLPGVPGTQVASWGEHYPLLSRCSLPAAAAEELVARFGSYRHPHEIVTPKRLSQELHIYDTIRFNVDRRLEATQFLLDQEDWDLFVTVFGEVHYAGHQFYHYFDRSHWAYDPARAIKFGEALPDTYAALDAALAALLKNVSPETAVFIVSVHGIETNYSANHLMPTVLEKLGFQTPAAPGTGAGKAAGVWGLSRTVRELLPKRVRAFINEHMLSEAFHDRMFAQQFRTETDWQRTRAFFLPSDHFQGFLSVNLKGREPWGVVEPGAEYDGVCRQLSYELKRLVNPDTGKPAIAHVVKISDVYRGENLYSLPDVVIQWATDGPIKRLHHPQFGVVADESFQLRKARHAVDGFMIATGKHIRKAAQLSGATTLDFAPTILYLMGQAVPRDMDGKVLVELIDDAFKEETPVSYCESPLVAPQELRVD